MDANARSRLSAPVIDCETRQAHPCRIAKHEQVEKTPERRAGRALACADAAWSSRRRDLDESPGGPVMPWGYPDFVLAAAVRCGVLTAAEAELIGRNRLEGVPLARIAAELQVSHSALCHRRRRAEARLTQAIRSGRLSDIASDATYGWRLNLQETYPDS